MKLYLIDGYGFVFRAFHSLPPLTRDDGTPIGAVYGFTNMLYKFLHDHEADMMAVILDSGQKNFRHDIYPEYKSNRPEAPAELIAQFPIIREVIAAFGISTIEKPGYEADDLIAAYTKAAVAAGHEVKIISSDKDLMQLVGEKVKMFDAMRDREISGTQVKEKFDVLPTQVRDVLSLIGDSSDHIPGVKGIGQKTAAELINEFGSLDGIYANLDKIKQVRRKQLLAEGKENAYLSQKLITLDDAAPLDFALNDLKTKELDRDQLAAFLQKQGFKNLLTRMGKSAAPAKPAATEIKFKLLDKPATLEKLLPQIAKHGSMGMLLGQNGFTLSSGNLHCEYQQSTGKQASLFQGTDDHLLIEFMHILKPIFEESGIRKILIDAKSIFKTLHKLGIHLASEEDVAIMAYALDTGKHGYSLKELTEVYLQRDSATSADLEPLFIELEHKLLEHKVLTLYNRIEKPMITRLAAMEMLGVKLDHHFLAGLSSDFKKHLAELEGKIWKLAGKEFNIGSPKQLGEVLFVDMSIPAGKKSKTGAYSTGADILESLSDQGFEIADFVLQWRQYSKLVTTYTEALPKAIDPKSQRVHTTFMMTVASTGRLSSTEPNLQNIPIRTEEGHRIRQAFIAEKGNILISADYSQIELRLLAHIAQIKQLQDAFLHNQDIHAITASEVFGVPVDQVDSNLRRQAKTINFGIIYGISGFGLARRLEIPKDVAQKYIDTYFKQYPGIKEYMARSIDFARKHGFISTLFGRRCYISGINDRNFNIRGFAERAAINAPLQGTAADLIKLAMVRLPESIAKYMTLQIHDELLFEVPEDIADNAISVIRKTMEGVIQLSVPITVDVRKGKTWATAH